MDSGATDHTGPPEDIPEGAEFEPNNTGKHFQGAGGGVIRKQAKGHQASLQVAVADVTRTLQSVSKTCGPEEGPGNYDVVFSNKIGMVMPPGVVQKILEMGYKPVAEYPRRGVLYAAEVELPGFTRQSAKYYRTTQTP